MIDLAGPSKCGAAVRPGPVTGSAAAVCRPVVPASSEASATLPTPTPQSWKKCRRVWKDCMPGMITIRRPGVETTMWEHHALHVTIIPRITAIIGNGLLPCRTNPVVSACCDDGAVHIRIDGRAVAHDCPALRQYVETALQDGCRKVFVHLDQCEHFDSTFLGTLLCLRRFAEGDDPIDLQLVNTSEEAATIIRRMGAASLFKSCTADVPLGDAMWSTCKSEQGRKLLPRIQTERCTGAPATRRSRWSLGSHVPAGRRDGGAGS